MIANAVKFSADDGAVDVERWRDDQFAEILVVDHGVGIKRDFLPGVFDRFRPAGAKAHGVTRGARSCRVESALRVGTPHKSQGTRHKSRLTACELVAVHAIQ